ncbi:hypothetical protein [uncultured Mesotoga sp.]|uniref:hypothetical protein n=2 Tax=Mesotoga TaxID=1184396 RepID=UPI002595B566|nr:hypothetical protein [uncultured Mesotoga sp.]
MRKTFVILMFLSIFLVPILGNLVSLDDFNLSLPSKGDIPPEPSEFSIEVIEGENDLTSIKVESTSLDQGAAVTDMYFQQKPDDIPTFQKKLVEVKDAVGAEIIVAESGLGWMARGTATYQIFPNREATLINKRTAYEIAYLNAKKNLAEFFNGMSITQKTTLQRSLDSIVTKNDTLSNILSVYTNDFEGYSQALLRGMVIYSVYDNIEENTIMVSVIATPKTLMAARSKGGAVIEANTIGEGLEYVITEISCFVVPPIGGKVVTIPTTGEVAIIAFGSEVRSTDPDKAKRAMIDDVKKDIAKEKAQAALVGFLQGEEIYWTTGTNNEQEDYNYDFAEVDANIVKSMAKAFSQTLSHSEEVSSIIRGNVGAGVSYKTYTDGDWWYVVAIYIQSVSKAVQDFYDEMWKIDPSSRPTTTTPPPEPVPQGPSGPVSDPGKL